MAVCGVVGSLSKMSRVAVSGPATDGVTVTAMVHTTCATSVEPHELVWKKSAALGPLMEIEEIVSVLVPFAMVTTEIGEVCATGTVESKMTGGKICGPASVVGAILATKAFP